MRSYTIRPWLASTLLSAFLVFSVGYISATGYLVYRDQILSGSVEEKTRLRQSYEDRIAGLRRELDQVTSSKLVQSRTLETRISALQSRQDELINRQTAVDSIMMRAKKQNVTLAYPPAPTTRPGSRPTPSKPKRQKSSQLQVDHDFTLRAAVRQSQNRRKTTDKAETLGNLSQELSSLATQQTATLSALMRGTNKSLRSLKRTVARAGIPSLVSSLPQTSFQNTGGPYEPLRFRDLQFEDRVTMISDLLDKLDQSRKVVTQLPFGSPLTTGKVSSRFGPRIDPFLKRPAMHSGLDFKARYGSPIRATGSGVVTRAERMGGYGLVVEISHGHGLSTRYAHMSRIKVKNGQSIAPGQVIGKVGSTGRSTGPHLHYETRLLGKPRNPKIFIDVGKDLGL